jgi:hypothetical protein
MVRNALYADHLPSLYAKNVEAAIFIVLNGEQTLIPLPDQTPLFLPTLKELLDRRDRQKS